MNALILIAVVIGLWLLISGRLLPAIQALYQ